MPPPGHIDIKVVRADGSSFVFDYDLDPPPPPPLPPFRVTVLGDTYERTGTDAGLLVYTQVAP